MIQFKAYVFNGKRTARKTLDLLEDNFPEALWLDDLALISRNKLGAISIHSTWAQDDSTAEGGVGWGAITGGLIGALLGPVGALAGALGGASIGGMIGTSIEYDFDDPKLDEFAESLANDSSSLILVADSLIIDDFSEAIGDVDAQVIVTDLDEKDVRNLRKILKKDSEAFA